MWEGWAAVRGSLLQVTLSARVGKVIVMEKVQMSQTDWVASFVCRDSLEMMQTLKKRYIGSLSQNYLISIFLMF